MKRKISVGARYRQAAARGLNRTRRIVAEMWRTHRSRGRMERALIGVVAAGVLVAVGLGVLRNLSFGPGPEIDMGADAGADVVMESPGAAPSLDNLTGPGEDAVPAPDQGAVPEEEVVAESPTTTPDPSASSRIAVVIPSPADLPAVSVASMEWPVSGGIVRPYGWYRHPVFGDWRHTSTVAMRPEGEDRTVAAALAGRVSEVVNAGGRWRVTIQHAGDWETEYDGLGAVSVSSYEVVETGQPIGTALEGTDEILFTVYRGGDPVDPQEIVQAPVAVIAPASLSPPVP